MVTLTTEHGEFQAETPEEAAKLARRAQRDATKKQAETETARSAAILDAYHKVYDCLYCLLAEHQQMPGTLIDAWDEYAPKATRQPGGWDIEIETNDGYAVLDDVYDNPIAYVWDCGGIPRIVFLQPNNGVTKAFAIGAHKNVAVLAYLPKVTMTMFRRERETTAG